MDGKYNSGLGLEEKNFFRDVVSKYLIYWPMFLVLMIIGWFGAWLYLRYQIPVYESSATLLMKEETRASELTEAIDMFRSTKSVENEIQIIRSRTLAADVVKELRLYAPVVQEGRLVNHSAYVYSPVLVEAENPEKLQASGKVYFHFDDVRHKVIIDRTSYSLNEWLESPYGKIKFIPNKNYKAGIFSKPARDEKKLFFSFVSFKSAVNNLIGSLTVAASGKQSTIINLFFKDEVPQRGVDILNHLILAYNKASIDDKNALASNTLAFIEERLRYIEQELDSVEYSLQQYRTKEKVVNISTQGQLYLSTVGANDQKISDFSMQLAVLSQVDSYIRGKDKKGNMVPSALVVNDPILSQLLESLYATELQVEKLRKTTPENNPLLVSLVDQIDKLRQNISENIKNQRHNLLIGRENLNATNNKFNSILKTIPQKERELLEINRQQSIKNNIYTFLLQKREEMALSHASAVSDSRIVDIAESRDWPVSPNKKTIYMVFILMSIALGVLIVALKELLNQNIVTRNEIEKHIKIPVLGEVALDKSKLPVVVAADTKSIITEQFRQLRTSLTYLGGAYSRKKKILITSSISSEGKTFIAVNMGMSLAITGKKVILIDLDLRNPMLSSLLEKNNDAGIANYFMEENEPEELIKKTGHHDNLFILPSGPVPPNPSELILSNKLQDLLNYLEEIFDYIIIDTAPVNPVTDAYIIAPVCDMVLYIIRQKITPRMFLHQLGNHNIFKTLKNIAIVFNGVKSKGFLKKYERDYVYGREVKKKKPGSKKQRIY